MKALVINSSYRTHGNSDKLCGILMEKLAGQNIESARIDLSGKSILQCRGCRLCFDKGETHCPDKDDLLGIFEEMKSADLLIWSSPVYVEDVNGLMKTFIDRLAFNCHRPALFNQGCFVYVNSGGGASNHAVHTMERANQTWGARLMGYRKLVLGANSSDTEILETCGGKIEKDIAKIVRKAARVTNPTFIQALTFYIQQWYYLNKVDRDSHDFRYWNDMGWLNPRRAYYTDQKMAYSKRLLARAFGKLIIRFMLT